MKNTPGSDKIDVKLWWQFTRPFSFNAAYTPVLIGSILAYTVERSHFRVLIFLAMFIASVMIQAATNLFNEYYDFEKGLDTAESVGIGGAFTHHHIKPNQVLTFAVVLYSIALLLGIYICFSSSWWLALVGGVCMAVGYLYTGGPRPIAYTPLSEVTSGLFMGSVIICTAYFIQTGSITLNIFLVAIPTTLFISNILLTNNIRDLTEDTGVGRKTLPIILGRKKAITLQATVFCTGYTMLLILPIIGATSYWVWLALASSVNAYSSVKGLIGKSAPAEMMPAMGAAVNNNKHFGLLLTIGIFFGTLSL